MVCACQREVQVGHSMYLYRVCRRVGFNFLCGLVQWLISCADGRGLGHSLLPAIATGLVVDNQPRSHCHAKNRRSCPKIGTATRSFECHVYRDRPLLV